MSDSQASSSKLSVPKKQSSSLSDDSTPPEKRRAPSESDMNSGCSSRIADNVSNWCSAELYGKLLLDKRYIRVRDNDLTAFITDTPGRFQFLNIPPEEQEEIDTYFKILDRFMKFDVTDAYVQVDGVAYQYGGYDRNLDQATKSLDEVYAVFSRLETCVLAMENDMPKELTKCGLDHLQKFCHYGMDFLEEATQLLLKPVEWHQRLFVDLFRVFSRLAGLQLKNGAREGTRHFRMFGQEVCAQPDLRSFVPLDLENWWRQRPVSSRRMPTTQTVTAVCEVKLPPPSQPEHLYDPVSVEKETEVHLGQLVGDMLAELLSSAPFIPVAACRRTHLIGILVLSTKVYFVKLHVPPTVIDIYRKPASSRMDTDIQKGTVYITQGFDFMKRKTRIQVLKILHKISTIVP